MSGRFYSMISSPVGALMAIAEGDFLTGVHFYPLRQKVDYASAKEVNPRDNRAISRAKDFLEEYFAGGKPTFDYSLLRLAGSAFSLAVWRELEKIEYGKWKSYGEISDALVLRGVRASPRAVGGAVGRNPVAIILPCHRVLASGGGVGGFGGGIKAKKFLLNLEKIEYRE